METLPGQIVTYETRRESNEKVDKKKKYEQIKYLLSRFPEGLTAKELSEQAFKLHYTRSNHRDEYAPRLTELSQKGVIGLLDNPKWDDESKRWVTVYILKGESKQMTIGDFI